MLPFPSEESSLLKETLFVISSKEKLLVPIVLLMELDKAVNRLQMGFELRW